MVLHYTLRTDKTKVKKNEIVLNSERKVYAVSAHILHRVPQGSMQPSPLSPPACSQSIPLHSERRWGVGAAGQISVPALTETPFPPSWSSAWRCSRGHRPRDSNILP